MVVNFCFFPKCVGWIDKASNYLVLIYFHFRLDFFFKGFYCILILECTLLVSCHVVPSKQAYNFVYIRKSENMYFFINVKFNTLSSIFDIYISASINNDHIVRYDVCV